MGSGDENSEGHQIANEKGSMAALGKYNKKNLSLKLPKESHSHIQYFGIWSPTEGMLSSVTFPSDMRLPPKM